LVLLDSAVSIVHRSHARMVSGKNKQTGTYWVAVEFPVQDVILMTLDLDRRPSPKASLRDASLETFKHVHGPFVVRFNDLPGHVTLGYNIVADDELIEKIKQYILAMLMFPQTEVCTGDPRATIRQSAHMPDTHVHVAGCTHNDDGGDVTANEGGDVTASTTIEALGFNNAYVPTDDKLGGMTWMIDLLPDCPLYQAIRYAWMYTMAEFTRDKYVDRANPNLERFRPLTTNLHWSLRHVPYTRTEWSIVTPLYYPAGLPATQVDRYFEWVYRYGIDFEGDRKATNREHWLRREPNRERYRVPVVGEIGRFGDNHPQRCTLSPWDLKTSKGSTLTRSNDCPDLTHDPPLIYRFRTYYRAETLFADDGGAAVADAAAIPEQT